MRQAKEAAEKAAERTDVAKALVASSKRGAELLEETKAAGDKALGSFLLKHLLEPLTAEEAGKLSWITSKQFGPSLKFLFKKNGEDDQKEAVYVVQVRAASQPASQHTGRARSPHAKELLGRIS